MVSSVLGVLGEFIGNSFGKSGWGCGSMVGNSPSIDSTLNSPSGPGNRKPQNAGVKEFCCFPSQTSYTDTAAEQVSKCSSLGVLAKGNLKQIPFFKKTKPQLGQNLSMNREGGGSGSPTCNGDPAGDGRLLEK